MYSSPNVFGLTRPNTIEYVDSLNIGVRSNYSDYLLFSPISSSLSETASENIFIRNAFTRIQLRSHRSFLKCVHNCRRYKSERVVRSNVIFYNKPYTATYGENIVFD